MALHPDGRPDDMLDLQEIHLRERPVDFTINGDRFSQAKDLFRSPTDRFFLGLALTLALLAIVTSFL